MRNVITNAEQDNPMALLGNAVVFGAYQKLGIPKLSTAPAPADDQRVKPVAMRSPMLSGCEEAHSRVAFECRSRIAQVGPYLFKNEALIAILPLQAR